MLKRMPNLVAIIDSIGAGVVSVISILPKAVRDAGGGASQASSMLISDLNAIKNSSLPNLLPTAANNLMRIPDNAMRLGRSAFEDARANLAGAARDVQSSMERGFREVTKIVK